MSFLFITIIMPSLMIIGTAHVIDLSSPLEGYIRDFGPTTVALELDRERWFALQTNTKSTNAPFFLKILSNIQKYLGDYFGSSPGSEMLVAGKVANSLGAEIKLIDKAIVPTIMGAWKNMPWIELWRMMKEGIFTFIGRGDNNFGNSMASGDFTKELNEFSEHYPVTKFHLIDSRDTYMCKNLVKLFRHNPNGRIVAVVGEGHVDGMSLKLQSIKPKIVRLRDLLSRKNNTFSFKVKI